MKKILFLFYLFALVASCKKEDPQPKRDNSPTFIYIKATDVNGNTNQSKKIILK